MGEIWLFDSPAALGATSIFTSAILTAG
jgi:hypothetical protein